MNTKGQRYKIKRPKVVADRLANTIGDIPLKQLYMVKKTAEGMPQKEIAEKAGIKMGTVCFHLSQFHKRTGLAGPAALTRFAIRTGMVTACWLLLAGIALAQPILPTVVAPPVGDTYSAKVSWDAVETATAYRLFYGTNALATNLNTTVAGTNITLPLPIGPRYYFKVRAQAGLDESDDSNIAVLNTAPGPVVSIAVLTWLVSWTPTPGKSNALQASTDLVNWTDVAVAPPGVNRSTQYNSGSGRNFRVRVLP